MKNNGSSFRGALLTVLIISGVITVKMAFLYAAEIVLFLLIIIPAVCTAAARSDT